MKKLLVLIVSLFIFTFNVKASDEISIYIFHGDGCGFCKNALSFLRHYAAETKNVKLVEYEVWNNYDNKVLMHDIATILETNVTGVPFIVIGRTPIKGFGSGDDENIKEIVKDYKRNNYEDVVQKYLDGEISLEENDEEEQESENTIVDNSNNYSDKNESTSNSFDVTKAGYTFITGAIVIILLLFLLSSLQNKKRTYDE